jgi:hypothetical protein
MSLQTINVGGFINDGTGDDIRTAFVKVNDNFTELDLRQGQNNTASNLGAGLGIFKEKLGVDLRFKSLKEGDGISISSSSGELTISSTVSPEITFNADTGTTTTQEISIAGGNNITTTLVGNILTIDSPSTSLINDPNPMLGANLDINGFNIAGTGNINVDNVTGSFFGNLTGNVIGNLTGDMTGLVYGLDVRNIDQILHNFDFGALDNNNIDQDTNFLAWIASSLSIDLGSVFDPQTTISVAGASATAAIGVLPPLAPSPGDMWWSTIDGNLYIRYSGSWVSAVPSIASVSFQPIPSSAIGQAGDAAGMLAGNTDFLYYCVANYDGTTNIWKRIANTGDDSWTN